MERRGEERKVSERRGKRMRSGRETKTLGKKSRPRKEGRKEGNYNRRSQNVVGEEGGGID